MLPRHPVLNPGRAHGGGVKQATSIRLEMRVTRRLSWSRSIGNDGAWGGVSTASEVPSLMVDRNAEVLAEHSLMWPTSDRARLALVAREY